MTASWSAGRNVRNRSPVLRGSCGWTRFESRTIQVSRAGIDPERATGERQVPDGGAREPTARPGSLGRGGPSQPRRQVEPGTPDGDQNSRTTSRSTIAAARRRATRDSSAAAIADSSAAVLNRPAWPATPPIAAAFRLSTSPSTRVVARDNAGSPRSTLAQPTRRHARRCRRGWKTPSPAAPAARRARERTAHRGARRSDARATSPAG